jgi:hypothetical protein
MNILNNVAVQWLVRRVPEWGGIIAGIIAFVTLAPPDVQATLWAVLNGRGGEQTALAYFGVASWLWAQFNSYRATVRPQAVVKTIEGTSVRVPPEQVAIQGTTHLSPPRRTLWDVIQGK